MRAGKSRRRGTTAWSTAPATDQRGRTAASSPRAASAVVIIFGSGAMPAPRTAISRSISKLLAKKRAASSTVKVDSSAARRPAVRFASPPDAASRRRGVAAVLQPAVFQIAAFSAT